MGAIGILKTGGMLFNHLSNMEGKDDVASHPDNELKSLDKCYGHATG